MFINTKVNMVVNVLLALCCMFVPMVTSNMERVIFSCNFDTDFCDFNSVASQNVQWTRAEGTEGDDTDGGYYAEVREVDGSPDFETATATIATSLMEATHFRISFNYAFFGNDVIYLQTDYRYDDGKTILIAVFTIPRNNEWMTFVGDFNASSKFSVQYKATKRSGDDCYIAIDNVIITELLEANTTPGKGDEVTSVSTAMPTFIEEHTRTVRSTYSERDSASTAVPTIAKASLNSKTAIALIWQIAAGVAMVMILCALLVCFMRRSLAKRKCENSSSESDYMRVHIRTQNGSEEAPTTLQSGDHHYENMNCALNQTHVDKKPERLRSRMNWRNLFQSSRSEVVHSNEQVNEVQAMEASRPIVEDSSHEIIITDEASRSSSDVRPLTQTPISLRWTRNSNYGHSLGEEPHYQELPGDDHKGNEVSSENSVDHLATSNASGKRHVYAQVNKPPNKTLWEENPIYEAGEEVEINTTANSSSP